MRRTSQPLTIAKPSRGSPGSALLPTSSGLSPHFRHYYCVCRARSFFATHTESVRLVPRFPSFRPIGNGIRLAVSPGRILAMPNENEQARPDTLRYLDADHVSHPSGTLAGVTVCSRDDQNLGAISGVLVEPAS